MKYNKKYLPLILIFILFLVAIFITYLVYQNGFNNKYLKVVFLDVGQGDAVYIEAPNKKQILIDSGQDEKVLARLSQVMPIGDRSLDLVIATHPDLDHIGGFSSIIDNYKVDGFMENGYPTDGEAYENLKNKLQNKKIKNIIGKSGMKIILDDEKNIYLDILFPESNLSSEDTNDSSIVCRLVYDSKSFMFMGDATIYSEILMHRKLGEALDSDVLKLGHHGSRTSSSVLWLEDVSPEVVIVSAGKNNRYGHPHEEVLRRLKELKIPYLSTILEGDIIFKTDGMKLIY